MSNGRSHAAALGVLPALLLMAPAAQSASYAIKQSAVCSSGCADFLTVEGSVSSFAIGYFEPSQLYDWDLFIQAPGTTSVYLTPANSTLTSSGTPKFVSNSSAKTLAFSAITALDGVTISGADANGVTASWQLGYGVFQTITYAALDGPTQTGINDFYKPPFSKQISSSLASPGPVVPIPAALPLLATALGGLGWLSWRRHDSSGRSATAA